MSIDSTHKIDALIAERQQMSQRLQAIDDQLLNQIRESAKLVHVPVSNAAVAKLIEQYSAGMSVTVLNTIGLELYVGEKNAGGRV
uniref:hypothetical protein n=1 Tax=Rheinheimera sp. TaxID=1869214 RepID=UPI00404829C7